MDDAKHASCSLLYMCAACSIVMRGAGFVAGVPLRLRKLLQAPLQLSLGVGELVFDFQDRGLLLPSVKIFKRRSFPGILFRRRGHPGA